MYLPRPILLTLKDAHQLAAGTGTRARARTHAVAVRPPFEGMVAENLDLLNVEHIVNYFRTLDSSERLLDDAAARMIGPAAGSKTKSSVHCDIIAAASLASANCTSRLVD
jgi:hypothetical protein